MTGSIPLHAYRGTTVTLASARRPCSGSTRIPTYSKGGKAMYRFHLVCPKCGKVSETIQDKHVPQPHVNCGNCLMGRVEVVEMKVVAVDNMELMSEQKWKCPYGAAKCALVD